jgi:thiamine monophosphate kinase
LSLYLNDKSTDKSEAGSLILKSPLTGERSQDGKIAGIGDDCAAYEIGKGDIGLFSAVINIEGVHFDLSIQAFLRQVIAPECQYIDIFA